MTSPPGFPSAEARRCFGTYEAADQAPRSRPLILGIGNLLLGDEGVGVHTIRRLERAGLEARADLLDGGTGGFHLLGAFCDRAWLILVDAAADGHPPGTVSRIRPRFASDFPRTLTAHDIGLKDLLESAMLLGALPEMDLITVSVTEHQPMSLDLSPTVAAALPQVEALIRLCLAERRLDPVACASATGAATAKPA